MQQDTSSSSNSSNGSNSPTDQDNNNGMMIGENLEASNLSPISCGPCRKAHKRCDRKFPSCSKCIQRGVDCFYNEPKKRGKASDSYRQKKRIKQDGTELKQIVHCYYSFFAGGYPILPKVKFQYFIDQYLQQIENNDEFQIVQNEYIASEEELNALYAFFLAIKCIYFQSNENLSNATETMTMCEEHLGKLLTKSMHFYIYAACQMVAVYYSGVGDLSKVRFYDTMVNYYLKGNEKTSFDKYEKNMLSRTTCLSKSSTDFIDEFSGFFKKMPSFFENSVAKNLKDLLLPGTLEYLQTAPKTLENYAFFKKVTEFTYKVMGQYHADLIREMKDCHSEAFFSFEQMHKIIMYHGFHLYYLKALPEITPQLEEVALKITVASESEYFRYSIPETIICIRGSSQVHFEICKLIESGKRLNNSTLQTSDGKILALDYYSLLEKDINALTILQKRFPVRVTALCENLLENMTTFLRAHNEGLKQQILNSTLIEENDLEPLAGDCCTSDCNSDQHSNDLCRSDGGQQEGEEKWKSLIHYLEAINEKIEDSNNYASGNTDISEYAMMDNVDLDQFL